MECKFEVGQKVVCINDTPYQGIPDKSFLVRKGETYTVRDMRPQISYETYSHTYIAIQFQELPDRDPGYACFRFKPLEEKKTDISIFTEILNRVNDKKVLDEVH